MDSPLGRTLSTWLYQQFTGQYQMIWTNCPACTPAVTCLPNLYIDIDIEIQRQKWSHICVFSRSVVSDSVTLWGFFRQEYWSELPCPTPGDLPNPGIEPRSPALQADSLLSESWGKPKYVFTCKTMWNQTWPIGKRLWYHRYFCEPTLFCN